MGGHIVSIGRSGRSIANRNGGGRNERKNDAGEHALAHTPGEQSAKRKWENENEEERRDYRERNGRTLCGNVEDRKYQVGGERWKDKERGQLVKGERKERCRGMRRTKTDKKRWRKLSIL